MAVVSNLIKRIVPIAINFPLFRYVGPLAHALRSLSYSFYYLEWYHKSNIRDCLIKTESPFGHNNRFSVYEKLVNEIGLGKAQIQYLEFGVHKGTSIRWWLEANNHEDSRFTGFDCFHGLPEEWGKVPKGEFSTHGAVPDVDDKRCAFVEGLFQETLNHFDMPDLNAVTILHLDADLYSSTLYVLTLLNEKLKTGDILIFDEFAYATDEFRAFLDFQSATRRELTPLYAVNCGDIIAFQVA
jgi:O-methyltransferase